MKQPTFQYKLTRYSRSALALWIAQHARDEDAAIAYLDSAQRSFNRRRAQAHQRMLDKINRLVPDKKADPVGAAPANDQSLKK